MHRYIYLDSTCKEGGYPGTNYAGTKSFEDNDFYVSVGGNRYGSKMISVSFRKSLTVYGGALHIKKWETLSDSDAIRTFLLKLIVEALMLEPGTLLLIMNEERDIGYHKGRFDLIDKFNTLMKR